MVKRGKEIGKAIKKYFAQSNNTGWMQVVVATACGGQLLWRVGGVRTGHYGAS